MQRRRVLSPYSQAGILRLVIPAPHIRFGGRHAFSHLPHSKWDGTQNIFDMDADQLMDLLSDDVLNRGDIMQALRDLFRQGMQNRDGEQMPGLRQLMEQLKERRRQQMQQHNMDSVLDDLKERLQDIIDTERRGIQNRLDDAQQQVEQASDDEREQQEALNNLLKQRADRNLDKLDDLPEGVGSQLRELMDYDFMDPEAQQKFQGIAGHAQEPDGPEHFPANAAADTEHVPGGHGRHPRNDARSQPDDARQAVGPGTGLRRIHGQVGARCSAPTRRRASRN